MKVDRKKFLIGTGVVILAVAAFGIANPNNGTHSFWMLICYCQKVLEELQMELAQ